MRRKKTPKAPEKMKKVVIKAWRDGQISWVHFSIIPEKVYKKFFKLYEIEPTDLNKYLSKWCKQDFDVMLRMYKYEDIAHLKKAIIERFQSEYPELYGSGEMPIIKGWVRMWLTQHMKEEIAAYEK